MPDDITDTTPDDDRTHPAQAWKDALSRVLDTLDSDEDPGDGGQAQPSDRDRLDAALREALALMVDKRTLSAARQVPDDRDLLTACVRAGTEQFTGWSVRDMRVFAASLHAYHGKGWEEVGRDWIDEHHSGFPESLLVGWERVGREVAHPESLYLPTAGDDGPLLEFVRFHTAEQHLADAAREGDR